MIVLPSTSHVWLTNLSTQPGTYGPGCVCMYVCIITHVYIFDNSFCQSTYITKATLPILCSDFIVLNMQFSLNMGVKARGVTKFTKLQKYNICLWVFVFVTVHKCCRAHQVFFLQLDNLPKFLQCMYIVIVKGTLLKGTLDYGKHFWTIQIIFRTPKPLCTYCKKKTWNYLFSYLTTTYF